MRINFGRLLLVLLTAYLIQRLLAMILVPLGVDLFIILVIIDFAMAFFFAYINYPPFARKNMLKDQTFHYNVLGYFVVFLLLDLLF